jgi:peptidoglycan/LPS O-acetylase OafA/YrhL
MRDFGRRMPELDGVRGSAILIILVYHWVGLEGTSVLPSKLVRLFSFGWSGVDLFFVLSGFLIGGILIDQRDSANYFEAFYLRRVYRIIPLYLVLCVWSLLIFSAHLSTHAWLFEGRVPWFAYLTFGQNFWMARLNAMSSRQIDATWSLAIEEQFYLTLPFVIRFIRPRKLPYLLAIGILCAPVFRLAVWFIVDPTRRSAVAYLLTPCRMDSLLLGVLAACAVRSPRCWEWMVAHKPPIAAASAVLALGFLIMVRKDLNVDSFAMTVFGYTWIASFYLSILLLAVISKGFFNSLFTSRPLIELGVVAYGLYLFHQPILGLVYGIVGRVSPHLNNLSAFGLTSFAAVLLTVIVRVSWVCFEKPLIVKGHRHRYTSTSD